MIIYVCNNKATPPKIHFDTCSLDFKLKVHTYVLPLHLYNMD